MSCSSCSCALTSAMLGPGPGLKEPQRLPPGGWATNYVHILQACMYCSSCASCIREPQGSGKAARALFRRLALHVGCFLALDACLPSFCFSATSLPSAGLLCSSCLCPTIMMPASCVEVLPFPPDPGQCSTEAAAAGAESAAGAAAEAAGGGGSQEPLQSQCSFRQQVRGGLSLLAGLALPWFFVGCFCPTARSTG